MAIDKAGNEGAWSDAVTFTVRDVTAPGKVSVKLNVAGNQVSLSWQKAKDNTGVTAYEVWGGTSSNDLNLLATLDADQFDLRLEDLEKGEYFYGIRALDLAGNGSDLKLSKAVIKTDLAAPELALLNNQAAKNSITLA